MKVVKPRPGCAPTYSPAVTRALITCWKVLQATAGRRLAPKLVPLLRRDGDLDISDQDAALLVRMSAATIDRRLAPVRGEDHAAWSVTHEAGAVVEVAEPDLR